MPYKVSQQLRIEYDIRLSEIKFLTSEKIEQYHHLRKDLKTIELLLSLSIFYKRVISNFDSANKFTSRVVINNAANSIQLGSYDFTEKEVFRLQKTIREFNNILLEYSIHPRLFDYTDTIVFLRKIKFYKNFLDLQKKQDGESF
ncbi:hypothetical protein ATB96_02385 [Elizabethkingia ursingii]|nr:hypothetical protein ATB96_02385 [Elizabethkingia ursingii]